MHDLQFAEIAHRQHTAAQDRHYLLLAEVSPCFAAVADLLRESVGVVLEVFYYFVLLRAEVGEGEYFVVVGIDIELMCDGVCLFGLFDVLVKQLFACEGMFDD